MHQILRSFQRVVPFTPFSYGDTIVFFTFELNFEFGLPLFCNTSSLKHLVLEKFIRDKSFGDGVLTSSYSSDIPSLSPAFTKCYCSFQHFASLAIQSFSRLRSDLRRYSSLVVLHLSFKTILDVLDLLEHGSLKSFWGFHHSFVDGTSCYPLMFANC